MNWPFEPLQMFGYDVIEIDCPWLFGLRSKKGEEKSAQAQYECMTLADIQALPVGHLARVKAVLMLWATIPMLPQGIATLEAFGAVYKSNMVWRKVTANGKVRPGTGYRVHGAHEHVLIGCFGHTQIHERFPSIFDGIVRDHSRKPEEFYEILREKTPNLSRCSLFSRETRPGFDGWGMEHGKFDPPPLPEQHVVNAVAALEA